MSRGKRPQRLQVGDVGAFWRPRVPRLAQTARPAKLKAVSEVLFEAYLQAQGISYDYEPKIAGKKKQLDYRLDWTGRELFCEVKELHASSAAPRSGHFDPYRGLRKEIHEARKQFKEYKADHCCVLVIHNIDDWEFRDWPYVLLGAMLGDASLVAPFDAERGVALIEQAQSALLDRGKMVDPKGKRPQNTGISAIAVLSEDAIRNPEFDRRYNEAVAAERARTGVAPPLEQRLALRIRLYGELPVSLGSRPRVRVFENPFALHSLSEDAFHGDFDERHRFNPSRGRIERVFVGTGLKAAEREEDGRPDILAAIERFRDEVVRRFAPQRIVLFGSHAQGSADHGSDVDLLVVFPGTGDATGRALDIQRLVNRDFPLDLLTISEGDLTRRLAVNDPFLSQVIANGKTLHPAARRGVG